MAKVVIHRGHGFYFNFKILSLGLSHKAIGIYVRLHCLAQNEDWAFSVEGLSAISKEGQKAILEGLRELEKVGLLRRGQERNAKGEMAGAVWDLYEDPGMIPSRDGEPSPGYPSLEKPSGGKPLDGEPPDGLGGQIKDISINTNTELNTKELQEKPPAKVTRKIPSQFKPLSQQIMLWWNYHRKGVRSDAAWEMLIRNLDKIYNDPSVKQDIDAIEQTIDSAISSSEKGKPWQSINYQNWVQYNRSKWIEFKAAKDSSTAPVSRALPQIVIPEYHKK